MAKYIFDVWTEIHGTATIDANSPDEAWDKLCEQKYDVELTDNFMDREACLIDVEEDE